MKKLSIPSSHQSLYYSSYSSSSTTSLPLSLSKFIQSTNSLRQKQQQNQQFFLLFLFQQIQKKNLQNLQKKFYYLWSFIYFKKKKIRKKWFQFFFSLQRKMKFNSFLILFNLILLKKILRNFFNKWLINILEMRGELFYNNKQKKRIFSYFKIQRIKRKQKILKERITKWKLFTKIMKIFKKFVRNLLLFLLYLF